MIEQIYVNVNRFTFNLQDNAEMQIDINPQDALQPITLPNDQMPALVYLAGIGRSSQRTMYGALTVIAGILSRGHCTPLDMPWHNLRHQHMIALRAWLIEHRSPATARRMIAAVKGTLKEAWRLGQIDSETYSRIIDIKPIKGTGPEQAAGRALSHGEKTAAIAALDGTDPKSIRDSAIFGLALYAGLRRSEIANLQLHDYAPATGAITVRGKGAKYRTVYAAPGVDDALGDWLKLRSRTIDEMDGMDGMNEQHLFLSIHRSGRIKPQPLTPEAIYHIMTEIQTKAHIKPFTPHDLRRTFAGDILDEGADMSTVQKLMGHSSPTTTASYDRRGERAKQTAISRLHMPYQRKFEENA